MIIRLLSLMSVFIECQTLAKKAGLSKTRSTLAQTTMSFLRSLCRGYGEWGEFIEQQAHQALFSVTLFKEICPGVFAIARLIWFCFLGTLCVTRRVGFMTGIHSSIDVVARQAIFAGGGGLHGPSKAEGQVVHVLAEGGDLLTSRDCMFCVVFVMCCVLAAT